MSRILRNTGATLEVTFFTGETAVDADGAVTVDITREDGTALVSGATADKPVGTTGVYRYTLAPQADLDVLSAKWTGTFGGVEQSITTEVEVVSGFYVSLAEIRALDALGDANAYPIATLEAARTWFEDLAENVIGRAQVRRYAREVLDGNGERRIRVGKIPLRSLVKVTVDDVVQTTTAEWAVHRTGKITRPPGELFDAGVQNVSIAYEHGLDAPDEELRQAALTAIRAKLVSSRSAVPETATTMTTEAGTFTLALAGANRPTGIPEVDAVLIRRRGPKARMR